ncbi:MAG: hypothetical protein CL880_03130 [Dehalococcoidia bacterium]|nr:hypothetical protein [Dehalococcoidia bacterium]MAX04697.1 hypothetical protein [Dehalococcoidia bacterium]|tara:strand:+ start:654 stop:2324 length:1671 start_codon:yes stop_codon:yes gene_type:complete
MARMTGKKALLEMLTAEGVQYIFGNPGTSEGAIMDALEDYPNLQYILGTQEGVAMGAADTYARATGKPAFINLHIETGLANGISLLHNAAAGGTPLVLTAGNKDMRKLVEGRTPLADMVKLFTKWSVELTHPEQIPGAIRKAFNEARTPPTGPTFIAFSANSLDGEADMDIVSNSEGYFRIPADEEAIGAAANILLESKNPIMLVGDRVAQSMSSNEAVKLAEKLGAPVYASYYSEMNFPSKHPLFKGFIKWGFPETKELLKGYDAVLAVGNVFSGYFFFADESGNTLSENTKLVHIDSDPSVVGNSEPTDVGVICDPKTGMSALYQSLNNKSSGSYQEDAKGRIEKISLKIASDRESVQAKSKENWNQIPMSASRMMHEIANCIPDNTVIVDDSVTTRTAVFENIEFNKPGQIFGERGGAIGWGLGAGIGAKLANPDRPVVAIVGDGSAMMTVQAFYTAATKNIPVIYVICNNQSYRVLKVNMDIYKDLVLGETKNQSKYLAMDFPTALNMAGLAEAMGVKGVRVTDPSDIGPELTKAIESNKPVVLDISIDGSL